jgi:hypothetical protein
MTAPSGTPSPERRSASALAATLFLMSRIALRGSCPRLSLIVMEHLDLLAADTTIDPMVRATSQQLFGEWQRSTAAAFAESGDSEDAGVIARDAIRKAMRA